MAASCKKQTQVEPDFATLRIAGFVHDQIPLLTNFSGKDLSVYKNARNVNSTGVPLFMNMAIYNEIQPVWFHAVPDTMPGDKPVMVLNLHLKKNRSYSLYVAGPVHALDTLLLEDIYQPVRFTDSITQLQFVNLIHNGAISVNLQGKPPGSLASGIPYLGYTAYLPVEVNHSTDQIIFEFRDAVTGDLLFNFIAYDANGKQGGNMSWLFRSRTMVMSGIRGVSSGVNKCQLKLMTNF
jgi:hypothetical protein